MSRKKILHVDDDERILRTVARFLEEKGYSVISTVSPFIAPIIQKDRPDLIIMDVDMPLLSGDRIMAILRNHDFIGMPVVFFSGKPVTQLMALTADHPSSSYVTKESGLPALLEKINAVINR